MTTTPHDALFKAAFSKPHHAQGLLRSLVPLPLRHRIAWPSLRVESGIAVSDGELDEQRMDLVYSAQAGKQRVLIYLLAEHQSKVDRWMGFRLLCYTVAIWKNFRAHHPQAKRLPAILPIVVHHSPTGWTAPVAFEDLLDADPELLADLGPYIPRFRFLLDDLSKQTDEALRARTEMTSGGRVVVLSLKHGRSSLAKRIGALPPDALSDDARDVFTSVLRYLLETSRAEPVTLRELLARKVGPEAAEEIMTTADMLRREGEARGQARGEAKGEVKGKRAALLLQLQQRFGRVPAAAATRIEEASSAELDGWFLRVLTAASLAEVLETAAPRSGRTQARRRTRD